MFFASLAQLLRRLIDFAEISSRVTLMLKEKFIAVWDRFCDPGSKGGLGFREGSLLNKVALGKFLWAVAYHQKSFWIKWIHIIYLKSHDFWTVNVNCYVSWY